MSKCWSCRFFQTSAMMAGEVGFCEVKRKLVRNNDSCEKHEHKLSRKSETRQQCAWDLGWGAKCLEAAGPSGFCAKHAALRCSRCGEQAVRSCPETWGPLCCGRPLCKSCRCSCVEDGHP